MNHTSKRLTGIAIGMLVLASAPAGAAEMTARQGHVAAKGLPAPYAALRRPAGPSAAATGKALYEATCLRCHGAGARGDGKDSDYYDPPPSDLVALIRTGTVRDGYLYWAISEGSAAIGKVGMEAYRDSLKPAQIWAIVDHLRALAAAK